MHSIRCIAFILLGVSCDCWFMCTLIMFVALRFINHSNVYKDFFAIFDLKEEVGWCFCWISLFETARMLARSLAKVITATADININIYVYLSTAWICMFIVYFCMIYRMKCSSYRNNSHGKCIHIHSDACTLYRHCKLYKLHTPSTATVLATLSRYTRCRTPHLLPKRVPTTHFKCLFTMRPFVKISQHLSLIFACRRKKQNHRLLLVKRYGIS